MNYLNSFFKKGLIEFGEILDKQKCDEIYGQIVNSRDLSKNIFRSKKEYFKDPNPRKTNPGKDFNNLTEKFDLSFIEEHPVLKKNLELLLGKNYETVMKNFVIGVPDLWLPQWLKKNIKKILAPNLGAFIKKKYRDITYFRGIDFHMDLIDHPKLVGRNLTLYIYLNKVNNRMSPLQLIEKSHILGATKFPHYLKNSKKKTIQYSSDNKKFKKFKKITFTGDRGNVYLWSSLILHGTNPQQSNIPRISLRYDFKPNSKNEKKNISINKFLKKVKGNLSMSVVRDDINLASKRMEQLKFNKILK